MPVFAQAYDPRSRYLTGLGVVAAKTAAFRMPSAQRLTLLPMSRRRRMALAGYDPRARYLTGLRGLGQGDDTSDILAAGAAAMQTEAPIPSPSFTAALSPAAPAPDLSLPSAAAPALPAGTYGSVVAPNTSVTYTPTGGMVINVPQPAAAAAAPSFFSSSTAGIPNTLILFGLGGIVLLAAMSAKGGR